MRFDIWLQNSEYTCANLAVVLGVSRAAIYAWLGGEYLPSGRNLHKLSALSQGMITIGSFAGVRQAALGTTPTHGPADNGGHE